MLSFLDKLRRRLRRQPPAAPSQRAHDGLLDFLVQHIGVSDRADSLLRELEAFRRLPPLKQGRQIPALYLLLEKYLVEVEEAFKRDHLRRVVQSRFPDLLRRRRMGLIFAPAQHQEMWLARLLLLHIVEQARRLYGTAATSALHQIHTWVQSIPTTAAPPPSVDVDDGPPTDERHWPAYLSRVSHGLFGLLSGAFGARTAGTVFERGYREVRDVYLGLETFPAIVRCLPDRLLDEEKIELLSRSQIQQVLLDKAEELRRINEQLLTQNAELEAARGELQMAKDQLEIRVEERTRELTEALTQRETLLKEVHHRVKNNMQVVCSLLSLQAQSDGDSEVAALLGQSHDRVRSMALIHEMLYNSGDLARIDVGEYMEALLAEIARAHAGLRLQVRTEIDHPPVDVEIGVPCGLIVTELVTNALKHGFAGRSEGVLSVSMRVAETGETELSVADDGAGWPADFDPARAEGLGLSLVQILARQLAGSVQFSNTAGVTVTVRFPPPAIPETGVPS